MGTGIHRGIVACLFLFTHASALVADEPTPVMYEGGPGWEGLPPELDGAAAGVTITEARRDLRVKVLVNPTCATGNANNPRNEVEARNDFMATSDRSESYNMWWERCVRPADFQNGRNDNNVAQVRPTPTPSPTTAPTKAPSNVPTKTSGDAGNSTPGSPTGGPDSATAGGPTPKPTTKDSLALLDAFLPKSTGSTAAASATPSSGGGSTSPSAEGAQHFGKATPAGSTAPAAAEASAPSPGTTASSNPTVDKADSEPDLPTVGAAAAAVPPPILPAPDAPAPGPVAAVNPSAPPLPLPFSVTAPSGRRPDAVPISGGMPPENYWGTRSLTSWFAPASADKSASPSPAGSTATTPNAGGKKAREIAPVVSSFQGLDKKSNVSTSPVTPSKQAVVPTLLKKAFATVPVTPPAKATALWSALKTALKTGLKRMTPAAYEASERSPASEAGSDEALEAAFKLPGSVTSFLTRLGDSTVETDPTGDLICSLLLALTLMISLGAAVGIPFLILRRKQRRAAALALLLLTFTGTGRADVVSANRDLSAGEAASLGSAEGYEGGEILEAALNQARARAIEALDSLSRENGAWCDLSMCTRSLDKAFCTPLGNLGDKRRSLCSAFLSKHARSLRAAAAPEASPFRVSGMPLTVTTANGDVRAVAAITRHGYKQPIVFSVGSLKGLEPHAILALLVHELGHKLAPNGKPITDDQGPEGFSKGSELLDAIGVSVAAYAASHLPPIQDPPYLSDAVTARFCSLAHDPKQAFIVGLYADLQERLPTESEVSGRAKEVVPVDSEAARFQIARDLSTSDATRSLLIRDYFQRFLQRGPAEAELKFHSRRLASAVPHFALVASLIGNKEFARTRGIEDDTTFISVAFLETHGRQPTAEEQKEAVAFLKRADRATLASLWFQKPGSPATTRWLGHIFQKLLNRAPTIAELAEARDLFIADKGWEAVVSRILAGQEYLGLQRKRLSACSVPASR